MGCFESVYVTCESCGERVEFQSKAGPCMMGEYDIADNDIPPVVAGDLDGEAKDCSCGMTIRIKTIVFIQAMSE